MPGRHASARPSPAAGWRSGISAPCATAMAPPRTTACTWSPARLRASTRASPSAGPTGTRSPPRCSSGPRRVHDRRSSSEAIFPQGVRRRRGPGRRALQALAVLGGSAAVFGLIAAFSGSDDQVDISMDSLELQKREGWNAGQQGAALRFPGSTGVDADESRGWRETLPALATELAPAQSSLAPFYV